MIFHNIIFLDSLSQLLSTELELNTRILALFTDNNNKTSGKQQTQKDLMLSWQQFVQVMAVFLLRKEVRSLRVDFLVKFLQLRKEPLTLFQMPEYMQTKVDEICHNRKQNLNLVRGVHMLWQAIRKHMLQKSNRFMVLNHQDSIASSNNNYFDGSRNDNKMSSDFNQKSIKTSDQTLIAAAIHQKSSKLQNFQHLMSKTGSKEIEIEENQSTNQLQTQSFGIMNSSQSVMEFNHLNAVQTLIDSRLKVKRMLPLFDVLFEVEM